MISFGRFAPLLIAVGLLRRSSFVDVDSSEVRFRMSWGFRADVPVTSIRAVTLIGDRKFGSIGVHGWRGHWLVNGSLRGLVTIDIDPSDRFRIMGLPLRLDQVTVSVEDPEGFIAALQDVSPNVS